MGKSNNFTKNSESPNTRICQSCGKKNSLNAVFCIECGKKMDKIILPFSDIYSENKNVSILPFASTKMEPVLSETKKVSKHKNIRTGVSNQKPKKPPKNKEIIKDEIFTKKDNIKSELNEDILINNSSEILSPLDEIKKANDLLGMGAITKEEFEIIKTKYIKRI